MDARTGERPPADRGNPHTLARARRRAGLDKRERALTAPTTLEQQGRKISHAAVARIADVSAWLTCTEGIRKHIEAAQQRRLPGRPRSSLPDRPPTWGVRCDGTLRPGYPPVPGDPGSRR
jgi:hypothetical protein